MRKPIELKTGSIKELNELFDDIYGRKFNPLLFNTAIDDLAGGASAATIVTKVNEILAMLRNANVILE